MFCYTGPNNVIPVLNVSNKTSLRPVAVLSDSCLPTCASNEVLFLQSQTCASNGVLLLHCLTSAKNEVLLFHYL